MKQYEQQLIRMELQVGQLIRIVAGINERLNDLEEKEHSRKVIHLHNRRGVHRT